MIAESSWIWMYRKMGLNLCNVRALDLPSWTFVLSSRAWISIHGATANAKGIFMQYPGNQGLYILAYISRRRGWTQTCNMRSAKESTGTWITPLRMIRPHLVLPDQLDDKATSAHGTKIAEDARDRFSSQFRHICRWLQQGCGVIFSNPSETICRWLRPGVPSAGQAPWSAIFVSRPPGITCRRLPGGIRKGFPVGTIQPNALCIAWSLVFLGARYHWPFVATGLASSRSCPSLMMDWPLPHPHRLCD